MNDPTPWVLALTISLFVFAILSLMPGKPQKPVAIDPYITEWRYARG